MHSLVLKRSIETIDVYICPRYCDVLGGHRMQAITHMTICEFPHKVK